MSKSNIDREIEEILERLDSFLPEEGRVTRFRRRSRGGITSFFTKLPRSLPRFSAGHAMLAAVALIVLALILNANGAGFATFVIIAALVLFFGAFIASMRLGRAGGPSQARYEKRWRGQVVDMSGSGPGLGTRIRHWLRRPSKKGG